mmetsp:Transcript_27376/g.40839  ORF Transcript_27376/g.40839 Transcript_27376/m.40839 type:complete len:84 (-) Transcript_27376:567-818(-)
MRKATMVGEIYRENATPKAIISKVKKMANLRKNVHIQTETVRRTVQKHRKKSGNWKRSTTASGGILTRNVSSVRLHWCMFESV